MNAAKIVERVNRAFPKANAIVWDGKPMVGEQSEHKDLPLVDCYSGDIDPKELVYRMGVLVEFADWLKDLGFYGEFHDAGTFVIYAD